MNNRHPSHRFRQEPVVFITVWQSIFWLGVMSNHHLSPMLQQVILLVPFVSNCNLLQAELV